MTPEVVITDNGSQFGANAFSRFSREFKFEHVTSSPYYSQSNGEAERAGKTMKRLFKKGGDPYLALLAYWSKPLSNNYSPAELLMNRKPKTNIPNSRKARKTIVPDRDLLVAREEELRQKHKRNFDRRHRARDLSPALPGDLVWVRDRREEGIVENQVSRRSYRMETPMEVLEETGEI